jgi:uncharacterized protein DUF4401
VTEATELADALVRRGLMPPSIDAPASSADDARPWFVSAVLGVAGWLAALFTLAFVWEVFGLSSPSGFATAGAVMLTASLGLYYADRGSAFFAQLALALWIAGQLGIAWWAGDSTRSVAEAAAIMTVLDLALLCVTPNRMARTLASFFACIGWALAIRFAWWDSSPFELYNQPVALGPALAGWLVIWAPLAAMTEILIRAEPGWLAVGARRIARPALGGLLAALAIGTWTSEPFASLSIFFANTGATNWLALWPLLGTAAALFAACCAFRLRERALLGLAVVGALLHAAQFYYVLGTTLVVKSVIMLVIGGVCLGAAGFLRGRVLALGARRDAGGAR